LSTEFFVGPTTLHLEVYDQVEDGIRPECIIGAVTTVYCVHARYQLVAKGQRGRDSRGDHQRTGEDMAIPIHTKSEHTQSARERLEDYLNKPTSSDPFSPQNLGTEPRVMRLTNELDSILSQFEPPLPDWKTEGRFTNVGTANAIESRTAEPRTIAGTGFRDLKQTSPWNSSTTPAWTLSSMQVGPAYLSKCPDTGSAKDEASTAIIVDPEEDIFSEIRLLVFRFYYLCSVGIECRITENGGDRVASSSSASHPNSQNTPSGSSKRKRTEKGTHEQVHEERRDDDASDSDGDHDENRQAPKRNSGPERDLRRDFGCWFFKWAPDRYHRCIEFHGKEIHAFRRVSTPMISVLAPLRD
jgi:hypothetical protein